MRPFTDLTKLKVNTLTEAALERPLGDQHASKTAKESTTRPAPPKLSKEEAALLHTSQLQALIRRLKPPGLLI
jgi:hypothetical protein